MDWTLAATPVLLILGGATLLGVLAMNRRTKLEIDHRVGLVATAPKSSTPAKADSWLKGASGTLNDRLRRVVAIGAARSWGMKPNAFVLLIAATLAGIAAWSLTHAALGLPLWFAILVTIFATLMAPRVILLRQQKKADGQFNDLFPGTADSVARMLRAGLPISTAVHSVSVEAPPPVNMVFKMVDDQTEIGSPIEEALDSVSQRIGLADFRFFAVAVALQHATGGNLAATLEILSDIVRRRRAVRLKAKAATSEIRVTAYVVGALPFLIVGALLLVQPGYLTPLFADPRGQVILSIAVGLLLLCGVTMRQLMRSVSN